MSDRSQESQEASNASDDEEKKPKYVGKAYRMKLNHYFYDTLVVKGQVVRRGDTLLLQSGEPEGKPYVCFVHVSLN